MELIDFVENQASTLSVADLNRLIVDLPAMCERFATIPSQTYPYLSDYLELLSLVANDEVTGPNRGPISQTASEAAFALLYFQSATDLIPDAYKLHWPLPIFDVDQLRSLVSPLRLDSFYSSMKPLRELPAPD